MGDSQVWTDLLKVKNIYLRGRSIRTKNGKNTIFWTDTWFDDKPLCLSYPVLYDLCTNKNITVFDFLRDNGRISFSRWLPPILFTSSLEVVNKVFTFHFENSQDKAKWKWNGNEKFSTRSIYDHISHGTNRASFKHIWKSKVPYKIKIFS